MTLRCTKKLLDLLGIRRSDLTDIDPGEDDWYANLLWVERRKCLLLVHAGTLFPVFVADVRKPELVPLGGWLVRVVESALLEEGLPVDTLGDLNAGEVRVAKTASRQVLGVMNELAFEAGWHIDHAGGLSYTDLDELNQRLRRSLHTKDGDYQVPLELVLARLG